MPITSSIPVYLQHADHPPAIGRYRASVQAGIVNLQGADTRLFTLRNAHASRTLLVERVGLQWVQTGAHTAAVLTAAKLWRLTGFSAVDDTNVAVVTGAPLAVGIPAAPGSALLRALVANAAGMTGGTMTKVGSNAIAYLTAAFLAALPTAGDIPHRAGLLIGPDDAPIELGPDEGFSIENQNLLGAAASSNVTISVQWSELAG